MTDLDYIYDGNQILNLLLIIVIYIHDLVKIFNQFNMSGYFLSNYIAYIFNGVFRRRKLQRAQLQKPPPEVDYEGHDCLETDEALRAKWEAENKTPDTGYSRQSSVVTYKDKDGHYSQVWNEPIGVNPEPPLVDPRLEQPVRLPGMVPHAPLVRLPTPPNSNIQQGLYDRSEHVYEKPK